MIINQQFSQQASTELLEDLDRLHSLVKQSEQQTDTIDRIFTLAKAHHLISTLRADNPFISLIKERIEHIYHELKNQTQIVRIRSTQPSIQPSSQNDHESEVITIAEVATDSQTDSSDLDELNSLNKSDSKEAVEIIKVANTEFNREQLRNDIIRIVHAEQQPISLKKICRLLEPKYGDSEGLRMLVSQLTSQLGSWNWHAANWWKPDYYTKGIYKASNYCVAMSAPDIDTDLYYVNWSTQGYVAKIRSYLSNFRKNPEVINGIYVAEILKLADVNLDLKEFTTHFNSLGSLFVVVDSAFYHRDYVVNIEIEYSNERYLVKNSWNGLDTHELNDACSLVSFLYELFATLAEKGEYQAATVTTNAVALPEDLQLLVDNGISLKPRRKINTLPQVTT